MFNDVSSPALESEAFSMRPQAARQPAWGVTYRVDAWCRLVNIDGNEEGRGGACSIGALEVSNGALRPRNANRHAEWRRAILDVSRSPVARYIVLQPAPCWQVAAMIPAGGDTVAVRLARPAFNDIRCIDAVARMLRLTPREAEVLALLLDGEVPKTMARRLGTSLNTVRTQLSALRTKSGLSSVRDVLRMMASLPSLDYEIDGVAMVTEDVPGYGCPHRSMTGGHPVQETCAIAVRRLAPPPAMHDKNCPRGYCKVGTAAVPWSD